MATMAMTTMISIKVNPRSVFMCVVSLPFRSNNYRAMLCGRELPVIAPVIALTLNLLVLLVSVCDAMSPAFGPTTDVEKGVTLKTIYAP
jgi:hypothetical protein